MKSDARIELISQEAIIKAIGEYDPTKRYTKGCYIDAYDKISWKVAEVIDEGIGTISIHYEGWSSRFNESDIKTTAYKLAPFRKLSLGYTGQTKQAFRSFKYIKEEKDLNEAKIMKLLEDPFSIRDPEEYTQFIRGSLFMYIDSLLTSLDVANPSPESFPEISDFLRKYMKLIYKWMKSSWDLINELDSAERWDTLHLIHSRASVAMAYPELSESLKTLFGGNKRSLLSFKLIMIHMEGIEALDVGGEKDLEKKAFKWCTTYFYKYFKELGGFQEILKMVKYACFID